jgi:hypothetical protein
MTNFEAYREKENDFVKTDKWKAILDVLSEFERKNEKEGFEWLKKRTLTLCVQAETYDPESDLYNFDFLKDAQESLKAVNKLIEINKFRQERISLDFMNAMLDLKSEGITINCQTSISGQDLFNKIMIGMRKSLTTQIKSYKTNPVKIKNILHGGTVRTPDKGEKIRNQNTERNSFFFHLAFIFKLYDLKEYSIPWGSTMPNEGTAHYERIADIHDILADGSQSTSRGAVEKAVNIMVEKGHKIIAFY